MTILRSLPLLLLAALPGLAEKIALEIDPAATVIRWTLVDPLHTVHGTFKLKKGDVWLDTASGRAGGSLVVDATSGESGSKARDNRMHKNVLESGRYPEFTFVPERIEGPVLLNGANDSEVQLFGRLTIHGATHDVALKVKGRLDQQALRATLSFAVPYVEWGMKDPSNFLIKVRDTVDIEIAAVGRVSNEP